MAESTFGIGILGAASIAKKNAGAIAKCRNGTGRHRGNRGSDLMQRQARLSSCHGPQPLILILK